MPVYVYPSVQYAKAQVWDGSVWQNLAGTSTGKVLALVASDGTNYQLIKVDTDGKVYIVPPTLEADLGTFTAAGAGTSVDTIIGYEKWTWQQINDASATAPDVRLQGSIDGTNWFDLDVSTTVGSEMRHVVNKPVRYVRANVVSMGDATSISVKVFAMR